MTRGPRSRALVLVAYALPMHRRRTSIPLVLLLGLCACGHTAQRRAHAIAKDDGQRVIAALESHENEKGEYPPSLEAIDTVGVRTASMSYVREGTTAYSLVIGASAGLWGASCTRRNGDTDWACRRWRK